MCARIVMESFGGHLYLGASFNAPADLTAALAFITGLEPGRSDWHLMSIADAAENDVAAALSAALGQSAFIGLEQNANGAEPSRGWHWTTGENLTYSNWEFGEPNDVNGGEDIGMIYQTGTWNDIPTTGRLNAALFELDVSRTVRLEGTGGRDVLVGFGTGSSLAGLAGDDTLRAGAFSTRLLGNGGADTLQGGTYADTLFGGSGRDRLHGDADRDVMDGGGGGDVLEGGAGHDYLTGGAGADRFVYRSTTDSDSVTPDLITDFVQGEDRIDLRRIDADPSDPDIDSLIPTVGLFTGTPGELRVGDGTRIGEEIVKVDLDGDLVAELVIRVAMSGRLHLSDILI